MADLLIQNGLLFTYIHEGYHALKLRRADLLIEDGVMAKIAPDLHASCETLDASGCLVLPGFLNMGSRALESRLLAGLLPDRKRSRFSLRERILPVMEIAGELLNQEQLAAITALSLWDGVRGGTTTALDLAASAFEKAVQSAGDSLGMRLYTGPMDAVASDCGEAGPSERSRLREAGITAAISAVGSVQEGRAYPGVDFLRDGVNTALATGYYGNCMQTEMRTAAFSAKQAEGNPDQYKATDAFYAATCAGARALGREDSLGRIDPGMSGDVSVVDMERLEPLSYPFMQYLYGASPGDVRHVVCRGNPLLREGRPAAEQQAILSRAKQTATDAILTVWEEARRTVL